MNLSSATSTDFTSQPHILVVDDDARIRDLVSRYLTAHGFLVMAAEDAAGARDLLQHFMFDALVVDVMMPGESGLEFTQDFHKNSTVPVLLLTALGEPNDRISGLEAGADDYLAKPFEPRELVLRLNAILRRTATISNAAAPFRIGRWRYDPAVGALEGDEERINLTSGEVALIEALAAHAGQILSREALAKACGIDAGGRTIDVQVTRLRRKIEEDTKAPRYLQTVRGKGYMLRVEDI